MKRESKPIFVGLRVGFFKKLIFIKQKSPHSPETEIHFFGILPFIYFCSLSSLLFLLLRMLWQVGCQRLTRLCLTLLLAPLLMDLFRHLAPVRCSNDQLHLFGCLKFLQVCIVTDLWYTFVCPAAFLKHPRTPPGGPGMDYQTADSEHLMKRLRTGQPDEVCAFTYLIPFSTLPMHILNIDNVYCEIDCDMN